MYDRVLDPNFASVPGLCFLNGFVQISNSGNIDLLPHWQSQNSIHMIPYNYDKDAPNDLWVKQLEKVWEGCEDINERINCLQEFVGLALLGKGTKHTKCLIFTGEGSNGKSVILDTIQTLFPSISISRVVPQQWGDKNYLALLKHSKLNISGELPKKHIVDSDLFKAVVDGEAVQVHEKYEKGFKFEPKALHIFAANDLPDTHDQTEGFWRRFILFTFPNVFSGDKSKEEIVNKILVQQQGIMAWAIEGASRVLGCGKPTIPPSSVTRKLEWKSESDQAAIFVTACCVETGSTTEVKSEELYAPFKEFCRITGHNRPMTQQTFQKKLGQMGVIKMVTSGDIKGRKRTTIHLLPRSEWKAPSKQNNELSSENWELGIPRRKGKSSNLLEMNNKDKGLEDSTPKLASTKKDQ